MAEQHPPRTRGPGFRLAVVAALAATIAVTVLAVVSLQSPRIADTHPQPVRGAAITATAFLAGCGRTAVVAPLTIPIWCSSSDQSLDDLTWSSWGGDEAVATGDLLDRSCACAGGEDSTVIPSAHLTLTFPAARPEWAFRPSFSFVWTTEGFVSEQDHA